MACHTIIKRFLSLFLNVNVILPLNCFCSISICCNALDVSLLMSPYISASVFLKREKGAKPEQLFEISVFITNIVSVTLNCGFIAEMSNRMTL